MKKILALLVVSSLFFPGLSSAELSSSFKSMSPSLSPLDGTIPPQDGVDLYVFNADAVGSSYTAVFTVNEEPASVVVIPAELTSLEYDSNAGELTVKFDHVAYVDNAELMGPPTSFAIALIGATTDGYDGIPTAMRGSWMATNLPPTGWELIPPSEEQQGFGYELNGPDGETAFFDMFIPQTMIDFLSDVYDEDLTVEDLAVFNGDTQASMSIDEVLDGETVLGAQVSLNVTFEETSNEFGEDDDEQTEAANFGGFPGQGGNTVEKDITVDRADFVSLAASSTPATKGETVSIFGWIRDCEAGENVYITSERKRRKMLARGLKGNKALRRAVTKKHTLGADCAFSHSYPAKRADRFQAYHKPAGERFQKSSAVTVRVSR